MNSHSTNDTKDFDLLHALENVEFCNMETGEYFIAIAEHHESTGTVVILQRVN